jgi:hypothetical protein
MADALGVAVAVTEADTSGVGAIVATADAWIGGVAIDLFAAC